MELALKMQNPPASIAAIVDFWLKQENIQSASTGENMSTTSSEHVDLKKAVNHNTTLYWEYNLSYVVIN